MGDALYLEVREGTQMSLRWHSRQSRVDWPHVLAAHSIRVAEVQEDDSVLRVDRVVADYSLHGGSVPLIVQAVLSKAEGACLQLWRG